MYKQNLIIPGAVGNLEAVWQQPQADTEFSAISIICHPHPLFGGNMNNKVVTTTAKVFNQLGLATICFNFRGIGKSDGEFAHAIGETEDCLAIVSWLANQWPGVDLWLAGFSFGSYVAANVASKLSTSSHGGVVQLLSIAPPVHHNDFTSLEVNCPWVVVQGDDDEVVPAEQVYAWYDGLQANKTLIRFPQAGHFFHGKLIELSQRLLQHYTT